VVKCIKYNSCLLEFYTGQDRLDSPSGTPTGHPDSMNSAADRYLTLGILIFKGEFYELGRYKRVSGRYWGRLHGN